MRKRLLARLAAAGAGGALALTMAAPAFADHLDVETEPESDVEIIEDNPGVSPSTGAEDCDADAQVKIEEEDDPWEALGGAIKVIDQGDKHYTVETDGTVVISAAHVKGGDEYTSFYFDPSVTKATNLYSKNAAGNLADLSNIWICYEDPPPPPPTPDPTPTPTEPPGEEPPGEEPPGEEEDEKPELPVTGAHLGGLLVLAGGLVAAGIAMLAVRRRRNLADLLES